MESNLDIDIRNADALGLSYGQYMALRYNPNTIPIKRKKVTTCPVCGEVVKPPRTKFCSDECWRIRANEEKRIRSYERYHSKIKKIKEEGD